jgi:hypothetical protein
MVIVEAIIGASDDGFADWPGGDASLAVVGARGNWAWVCIHDCVEIIGIDVGCSPGWVCRGE